MSNTYKDNPARGLSKLQKAILVSVLDWQKWMGQFSGDETQPISWSIRPSYYGGPHPLADEFFGGNRRYELKEKSAVSRSLKRLWKRGLVVCYVDIDTRQSQTRSVKLTEIGREVASRLTEEGATKEYRNLWEEGKDKQIEFVIDLLRATGLPEVERVIEKVRPMIELNPYKFMSANLALIAHWISLKNERKG